MGIGAVRIALNSRERDNPIVNPFSCSNIDPSALLLEQKSRASQRRAETNSNGLGNKVRVWCAVPLSSEFYWDVGQNTDGPPKLLPI